MTTTISPACFIKQIRQQSIAPVNKIAFIISNVYQCEHFYPIMRHLGDLSEALVINPCRMSDLPTEFISNFNVKQVAKVSNGFQYPYYKISMSSNATEFLDFEFEQGGNKLKSKISVNSLIGETAIRLVYSIGKEHYEISHGNSDFDQIFVNGPYSADLYKQKTGKTVVQVGAYRLDDFFNHQWDKGHLLNRFNCDPTKKVIAWLPTVGDNAFSLDYHLENIAPLTKTYNIVLRPHPNTFALYPESIQNALNHGINNISQDPMGNLPLFWLADYMLFDYGGSMFNAIYVGKKFLLLDCPNVQSDSEFAHQQSPEFSVRNVLPGFQPGDCLNTALSSNSYWDYHRKVINKLKDAYYLPNSEGRSAKIVADRLRFLLQS